MKKSPKTPPSHRWRFFRAGGFDQARLDTAADLLALSTLDQKLWVALACPVDNVFFDARTLSFIDSDGDRRIRPAELIAAIQWTAALLKNPEDMVTPAADFTLESISDATECGKSLVAAMRSALIALDKKESDPLSIAEIESLEKILSQKRFNGDGVITEKSTDDESLRMVICEIIAASGVAIDRSGDPGITEEKIKVFFEQAKAHTDWIGSVISDPALRPLGDATESAARAISAVQSKIDDYFARCAVAEFDQNATAHLCAGEKQYEALGLLTLSAQSDEIARLPLARIAPKSALPLHAGLNPAWTRRIKEFETTALKALPGSRDALTEADWRKLLAVFAPVLEWQNKKPATPFDTLGTARAQELLGGTVRAALLDLIGKDQAEAGTFDSLFNLEKLARCRRHLHPLCTNFVNFKDFYSRSGGAIFQAGTLFLDQRSCTLCIKVDDANKHAVMAAMAGTYLAYCECRRPGGAKMTIVAAFTNGDSDNIIVGRNGIFYDRNGVDWDATVIKIIENPISLRQAFWQPYKSFVRMIETQVAKRASAAEAQSTAKLEQTATATAAVDATKPPPAPKKLDIGVVAALGVAAGALGTFIATLLGYTSGIIKLGPIAIVATIAGLLLLISTPSLILAYIKLRKRNLGPILDAGGWAINAKARVNVPFGTVLTHIPTLPQGSQRDLVDPYAEKKSPWPKLIVLALLVYAVFAILNHFGFIHQWTDGRIGHTKTEKPPAALIEKEAPTSAPLP